jgi:hypothetical protein
VSFEPIDEYPLRKLTAMARKAAMDYRAERARLEKEGKAIVLCPPDCPAVKRGAEHAHTWWDMWRMKSGAEYEVALARRAREVDEGAPLVPIAKLMQRGGVGEVHLNALRRLDPQHPKSWAALRAARLWVHQERPWVPADAHGTPGRMGALPLPWLVLLGPTGRGKTQAGVYAMEKVVHRFDQWAPGGGGRRAPPCMLVQGAELPELSRVSWNAKYGTEQRLEDILRTPFLLLDDVTTVAKQQGGGPAVTLLLRILDHRYSHKRYTVMTDNSTADAFEARLDFQGSTPKGQEGMGRIWRRCMEVGMVLEGQEFYVGGVKTPLRQPKRETP